MGFHGRSETPSPSLHPLSGSVAIPLRIALGLDTCLRWEIVRTREPGSGSAPIHGRGSRPPAAPSLQQPSTSKFAEGCSSLSWFYCTLRVTVAEFTIDPLVAVTVKVYVCGGCRENPLPPPHPLSVAAAPASPPSSTSSINIFARAARRSLRTPNSGINSSASPAGIAVRPNGLPLSSFRAWASAVWTVIVTVCGPPFAAIVAGENVAVAPGGSPETVNVTGPT